MVRAMEKMDRQRKGEDGRTGRKKAGGKVGEMVDGRRKMMEGGKQR